MRTNITVCLDSDLLREIDRLRNREKRSTFVEHLIKLGLRIYKSEDEG